MGFPIDRQNFEILFFEKVLAIASKTFRCRIILKENFIVTLAQLSSRRLDLTSIWFCVQVKMQFKQKLWDAGQLNRSSWLSSFPHEWQSFVALVDSAGVRSTIDDEEEIERESSVLFDDPHKRLLGGKEWSDSVLSLLERSSGGLNVDWFILSSKTEMCQTNRFKSLRNGTEQTIFVRSPLPFSVELTNRTTTISQAEKSRGKKSIRHAVFCSGFFSYFSSYSSTHMLVFSSWIISTIWVFSFPLVLRSLIPSAIIRSLQSIRSSNSFVLCCSFEISIVY